MDHADPQAIAAVSRERTGRRRLSASMLVLLVALVVGVASAGVIWLEVVRTLRKPDPVFVPKPPVVAGVVWSNRVFVDRMALKQWLTVRHKSYARWERQHPLAAELLGPPSASR